MTLGSSIKTDSGRALRGSVIGTSPRAVNAVLHAFTASYKMPEELYDLELEELNTILSGLKWLRSEPRVKINEKIDKYTFKPFDKITLGEFIDADYFTVQDKIVNIPIITAIFYRQTKEDEWENRLFEPYEYDIYKRSEVFKEIPITAVFGLVSEYLKFRDNFMKQYENLFAPTFEDDEDTTELSPEEKKEVENEKKKSKYAWESLIYGQKLVHYIYVK